MTIAVLLTYMQYLGAVQDTHITCAQVYYVIILLLASVLSRTPFINCALYIRKYVTIEWHESLKLVN